MESSTDKSYSSKNVSTLNVSKSTVFGSPASGGLGDVRNKVLFPSKNWCDHSPETVEKLVLLNSPPLVIKSD